MNSSEDWQKLQVAARRELARRNPDSLLDWSVAHRFFNGKPMRLIPALKDIYRDRHPFVIIQKAAQVFASEFLINVAFWAADSGQGDRGNVLFLMPTGSQVDDFSQARFDKAISESAYLQTRLFPPPPGRRGPARQNLKKIGAGYIYLRGTESQRQLTSVDADVVLLDEYDLMAPGVLDLARNRIASSRLGWVRIVSTPRVPEAGINGLFRQSDQHHFLLKCPACGRDQILEWGKNVDEKKYQIVCSRSRCRKPLDLWGAGRWEAAAPGNEIRGYHLSRLYSPLANIEQMVRDSQATTPSALQEFQNSVLGETFVPPGGQLTLDILDRCRADYEMVDGGPEHETYMGVDVGLKLHVVVREPQDDETTRAVFVGIVDSFEQVDSLISRFRVKLCVIDAQPETHKTRELANKRGQVWRAFYHATGDHTWKRGTGRGEKTVNINRTEAIEEMLDGFHRQRSLLPVNGRDLGGAERQGIGEYYREMMAMTRELSEDSLGNWVARFDDRGKPDHFAHAETYCTIARATYRKHSTRIEAILPRRKGRLLARDFPVPRR